MQWSGAYISSDETLRHMMPIAMWMGTVCLNLVLFKNTLSEKTVVRPEMSKMPQPAGTQCRKENEPCKQNHQELTSISEQKIQRDPIVKYEQKLYLEIVFYK